MMENWKVVKLADYYKISSGLSKSADQFGSGYPFVSFKNVFWNYFLPDTLTELVNTSKKEQDKCSVKKGDVFLTRTSEKVAELGMSSVALKDYPLATFNGFTKRLRPISGEINPIFIGFYLRSIVFRAEITAYSTLTTRASLNNDIIGRLRIHLPPLSTQRKIAGILSAYDDLIENNLKRIKLLEEKARLTYEEWFVRMKFPGHENTPIDEATGLPEGWVKSKIGNIIEVGRGSSPRPISNQKYFIHGNIPWLKIADATASHIFIYQTKQYINEYGASFSRKLPIDSIVVAASGTLGFPMILGVEACIHDGWLYFKGIKENLKEYFYFSFAGLKEYFKSISYGTAIQNINTNIVRQAPFIIPDQSTSRIFKNISSNLFQSIKKLQNQNQLLKEARDLLLPRLMMGIIDVEQIDLDSLLPNPTPQHP